VGDLVVAAVVDDGTHCVEVARCHHHDDLFDRRVQVHRRQRVLEDGPAGDLDQLLGNVETDAGPDTAREDHSNIGAHR
jgi:hypothetical protein